MQPKLPIRIYDSIKKQKCDFNSLKEGQVRFYVCGPTVYDHAHLGHARSSITFDLWRRVLIANGYEVCFAKNFTDIDDKIIKKIQDLPKDLPNLQAGDVYARLESLTTHYIDSYLTDMDALGVLRADLEPKATQSLPAIISMIESLLHKGYAYKGENNDVYLSIAKDSHYGSLSKHNQDHTKSRIESASDKLESKDFALWKGYKGEGDVGYESALGKGRPGWHIECSAMIEQHLAYEDCEYRIDIHAGGADLLFPHHENEASQTRCATDKELAKYWLHNGFVNINGEKMSKSLGNSFFIKDALRIYHGEIVRNYLLGTHYRLVLDFNEQDLLVSKKRLDKLYRLKKRLKPSLLYVPKIQSAGEIHTHWVQCVGKANAEFVSQCLQALNDDLNISKALSVIEEMISSANEHLDKNPKDNVFMQESAYNLALVEILLGIGTLDSTTYFQLGVDESTKMRIESLIAQRLEAKAQKDFVRADSIREDLRAMGIEIMDTPQGTMWEKQAH
ncbi:cysteine--tRNA ligase [uncultured Helicobacter sp.]|uniref:cysteine--tRNA ligase n=1 Tax=uncultured Helicobacter sp. TaxID=175537 RepID=UPI00374F00F4